jgi:hypothetical protein
MKTNASDSTPVTEDALEERLDELRESIFRTVAEVVKDQLEERESSESAKRENAQNGSNMSGVAGRFNRNYQRDSEGSDPDDVPAGGRKAYERRKMGLPEVHDDPENPAMTRSDWEERRQTRRNALAADSSNSPDSDESDEIPAGGRSHWEARQRKNANQSDLSERVANHAYPLTAQQKEKEEREKEVRRKRERGPHSRAIRRRLTND